MGFGNASSMNTNDSICVKVEHRLERLSAIYFDKPIVWSVIVALYSIIAIWGAFGNALVIAAVFRCQQMRTMRNYFICVLAVSDFCMCTISLPFTMKLILITYWDLGEQMCKIISSVQTVNVFVSTMAMASISADRFVVILFPTKFKAQKIVILISCILITTIAVAMAAPTYLSVGISKAWRNIHPRFISMIENVCQIPDLWMCHENRPVWSKFSGMIYTTFCLLFQYLIPLASLIFLNLRITRRLDRRPAVRKRAETTLHVSPYRPSQGEQERLQRSVRLARTLSRGLSTTSMSLKRVLTLDAGDQPEGFRRNLRIKRIMFTVVITFAICWLPLNVLTAMVAYKWVNYNVNIHCWCLIIAMLSPCANPVIYGALNENFRSQFIDILNRLRPSCPRFMQVSSVQPTFQDTELAALPPSCTIANTMIGVANSGVLSD